MNKEEELNKTIEQLKERINKPRDLVIQRVPKTTLSRFHQIANQDDFCRDYGMALKYLIDFHDGVIQYGTEGLTYEFDTFKKYVKEKFQELENKKEEQPTTKKRRLDGSIPGEKK